MGGLPPALEHLTEPRRRLWDAIVKDYVMESHHLELIELALVEVDRAAAARQAVEEDGITVAGRYGPRANPAVAIERDATALAARLFRQLDLEEPPPPNRLALRRRGQRSVPVGVS